MRTSSFGRLFYAGLLTATLAVMTVATGSVGIDYIKARAAAKRSAELNCLAENVYYEARGEPLVGQYGVAEVTMNRVESREFPNSVCKVVHQRGAFSWTYQTQRAEPFGYEWRVAKAVADSVYNNLEAPLVNGALFYHATRVTPDWAASRQQVAFVGRHIFYL